MIVFCLIKSRVFLRSFPKGFMKGVASHTWKSGHSPITLGQSKCLSVSSYGGPPGTNCGVEIGLGDASAKEGWHKLPRLGSWFHSPNGLKWLPAFQRRFQDLQFRNLLYSPSESARLVALAQSQGLFQFIFIGHPHSKAWRIWTDEASSI